MRNFEMFIIEEIKSLTVIAAAPKAMTSVTVVMVIDVPAFCNALAICSSNVRLVSFRAFLILCKIMCISSTPIPTKYLWKDMETLMIQSLFKNIPNTTIADRATTLERG